jgi:CHAT domain-containing protein
MLTTLRRGWINRPQASGALAVVADPAYGKEIPRLPYSQFEARSILSATQGKTFLATGLSADRETVLSGALARYRVLHFAAHANSEGLMLSEFDEDGLPKTGLLKASEICRHDFPAELVVLSSCRTALEPGTAQRGGLAEAFLCAGAKRVVASLWNVDDRSTAVLMERFYRAMGAGETPAGALRQAQISFLGDERYGAPYYWAGFVLQGEWR